jgi:glyoxylase-like metal-dependent hydrolase (beta-lactamase superfamily II)
MDIERFLELVNESKGKIVGVVDTHIHADHLSGSREVQKAVGCPIFMHEGSPLNFSFEKLAEREYDLAGLKVQVIYTPGHAPEHVSLLIDGTALLSGDCLLVGDVGRTDLGRGNVEQLYDSLAKLLKLEDRIEILPAHVGKKHFVSGGTSSTIGIERRSNPALQLKSKSEFSDYMTKGWPPKPAHNELFVNVNRGLMELSEAQGLAKAKQGELYSD